MKKTVTTFADTPLHAVHAAPAILEKPVYKDDVTIKRIQLLLPKLRDEATEIYRQICIALSGTAICRFSHTLRTFAEQNTLYAQGRTTPGKKVTNAKAGQSFHNFGMAIDICLLKDENGKGKFNTASWETNRDFDGDGIADWQEIVRIFKAFGWEWGGDWGFKDMPHFQKTLGYSISQLQTLHSTGKTFTDNNTKYVIL